nr:N-6 DNA methylase [Desulfobacteraceae bacterium]
MAAPDRIRQLVETFHNNLESYKRGNYNETQVRLEFINPFFEALGWDMNNTAGYAEAYKDVIHEDAIRIGGVTKAPDYCFRVGGARKFFLEAKKPSVNIRENISPAFQLRRYAWSAKLSLSVLTDFEEFAVYDCRVKPSKTDNASHSRIMYLRYPDYISDWDRIAAIFSKQSILKGSFDKYAETTKVKKGTTGVDAAFLQEIERWRDLLARNIALRNPGLSQRELNFAVQQTVDRIIFLRICEDRGIETYGRLMECGGSPPQDTAASRRTPYNSLTAGGIVYRRLIELFRKADEKYNSGLFHFAPEKGRESADTLTPGVFIDDKALKDIFKNLYYPDSPYEFSVLPADILGQVYEKFLGKIITLTSGHQARIEEKPEVRKAGGVYYTPTYIVDYIVKNTVGALLSNKKPGPRADRLKILDPACGSGSFLIGAYQYLLDWRLSQYLRDGPEKWAAGKTPRVYQTGGGEWRLTTGERKRILLNSIFGVDIDPQAVEVTKLSLLLKVLEGETGQSIGKQMLLFQERVLPDLERNIKCGNSLIGPDYYELPLPTAGAGHAREIAREKDDEEMYRVNAFDWHAEFPDIMNAGGFDAVIGNPPYVNISSKSEQNYFLIHYNHQNFQQDLYLLFLERYELLLRKNGLLGVIVSNTWLQSVLFKNIRKYLSTTYSWQRVLYLPEKVFQAVVDTHALIFKKDRPSSPHGELIVDIRKNGIISEFHRLEQSHIPQNGDVINLVVSQKNQEFFKCLAQKSIPLASVCKIFNGVKPFEKGKGLPPQDEKIMKEKPFVRTGERPDGNWSPLLRGRLIQRYVNLWDKDYWIQYGEWLAAPRDPNIFQAPLKIAVRQTGDSIIAAMVEDGFIMRNNLHILLPNNDDY